MSEHACQGWPPDGEPGDGITCGFCQDVFYCVAPGEWRSAGEVCPTFPVTRCVENFQGVAPESVLEQALTHMSDAHPEYFKTFVEQGVASGMLDVYVIDLN